MTISRSLGKKIIAVIGVIVFLCVFAEKVAAQARYDSIDMYYYLFDENGEEYFESNNFLFYGRFTEEEKALFIFNNLFDNVDESGKNFIPLGTNILDIKINNDILILDVSQEIRNYGGSAYENALIKQIAKNASNFEHVEKITITIDGNVDVLSEGSLVFEAKIGDLLGEN